MRLFETVFRLVDNPFNTEEREVEAGENGKQSRGLSQKAHVVTKLDHRCSVSNGLVSTFHRGTSHLINF